MKKLVRITTVSIFAIAIASSLAACTAAPQNGEPSQHSVQVGAAVNAKPSAYPTRAFFGETHLHTSLSGDAVFNGTRINAEQALRFARGEKVRSNSGQEVQLAKPLDFLMVSDHAEGIGTGVELLNENPRMMADPTLRRWSAMMRGSSDDQVTAARELISAFAQGKLPAIMTNGGDAAEVAATVWSNHIATVERYNQPGVFTAFNGFEWTSLPKGNNLHRNVMFADGPDKVGKVIPYTAFESRNPRDLWRYMKSYQDSTGGRVLAIPHNGNLSNGLMFARTEFGGEEMTADYAALRSAWEPLTEVVQTKGASESHPFLSPTDDLADFGTNGWDIGNLDLSTAKTNDMLAGEYAREALKRGLEMEQRLGVNPFKFGMIGAGDLHTGLSSADDNNFVGETADSEPSATRATAAERLVGGVVRRYGWQQLTGGLAGVWATENTRDALFNAMRKREVFATTGPRMTVRLFGGWDFSARDFNSDWVNAGYVRGVPMGSDLRTPARVTAPRFIVQAMKDPSGANLDRVQIIKGWVDAEGKSHEKIYNVVWSDPARRHIGRDGKLAPVGDTVNLTNASYANTIGAAELRTVWVDPDFNASQRAFYYARVVEIPTPRWPVYDAVRYGIKLPDSVIQKQQDRAFTSPIWYKPRT